MQVTVIGAGALGRLWLHHLALKGHTIHAWTKDKGVGQITYTIDDLNGTQIEVVCSANNPAQLQSADVVLVTLKAFSVVSVLKQCLPVIPKGVPIIIIHNGMGLNEQIDGCFLDNQHQFYYGITTQAANIKGNTVIHAASGKTNIGHFSVSDNQNYFFQQKILADLNEALPEVVWSSNLRTLQWQKLMINALINPMTVKYQCNNGQLIKYQNELEALSLELNLLLVQLIKSGELVVEKKINLFEDVLLIIEQTSANLSSMYQDYLAKRPSEIDYITGYVLQAAKRYNIHMPLHEALYKCVQKKMQLQQL